MKRGMGRREERSGAAEKCDDGVKTRRTRGGRTDGRTTTERSGKESGEEENRQMQSEQKTKAEEWRGR